MLQGPLNCSILKRACDKGLAEIVVHNLREYSTNKHRKVDDYKKRQKDKKTGKQIAE